MIQTALTVLSVKQSFLVGVVEKAILVNESKNHVINRFSNFQNQTRQFRVQVQPWSWNF